MTGHDPERAFVQTRLDHLADRFDQARAEMQADLDVFRDDMSTGYAEMIRAHQDRVREMEADQRRWLTNWLDGDSDEGRPTIVDQGQVGASAAGTSPASPPGSGPGQPNHAADLAEAIKAMSMQEYAQRRAEFGIRSPTDMNRLFGETR